MTSFYGTLLLFSLLGRPDDGSLKTAFEQYVEIERIYRAWEHHSARAEREWDYPWSLDTSTKIKSEWNLEKEKFVEAHGGDDFLVRVRNSDLFKRNFPAASRGSVLPDRNSEPIYSSAALESLLVTKYPRDHVSVGTDGKLYFDYFDTNPHFPVKLEVFDPASGITNAFPNEDFQSRFIHIHSVRVDSQNRIWVLDSGGSPESISRKSPKIFAFNANGDLLSEYSFPRSSVRTTSLLNDMTIDEANEMVFISDTSPEPFGGKPAIVIYDFSMNQSIRVLEGHISVSPATYLTHVDSMNRKAWTILAGLVAPKIGIDGIVFDPKRDYLYYAPNNGGTIFGIQAQVLRDRISNKSNDQDVAKAVDFVAHATMTDGMAVDRHGLLYLTDTEHSSIVRLDPWTGKLTTLIRDTNAIQLISNLEFGPDGNLYFATFPFHQIMQAKFSPFSDVENLIQSRDYKIYRLSL